MTSPRKPYRLLPHTADVRFRVQGRSFADLLSKAVFALFDQCVDAARVSAKATKKIDLRAQSPEEALVRLLQEALFLFDAKGFVARSLKFSVYKEGHLTGRLAGERFDPKKHRPKSEIKAATFHGLKIRKRAGLWSAEIVLDV
ncbi:MAG TPA: archease [bacterium]|nr:archease [bacterium]